MLARDLIAGYGAVLHSRGYVYSSGMDPVRDAGQWYMGWANAFLAGVPLEGNSIHYMLPGDRVCDINTEEDWQRAERMYQELQEHRIEREQAQ